MDDERQFEMAVPQKLVSGDNGLRSSWSRPCAEFSDDISTILPGLFVWCLTALSAQIGYIVPSILSGLKNNFTVDLNSANLSTSDRIMK